MADRLVTVCAECLQASCWHGEFMCACAQHANVIRVPASDLDNLNREHPDNYSEAKLMEVCGAVDRFTIEGRARCLWYFLGARTT